MRFLEASGDSGIDILLQNKKMISHNIDIGIRVPFRKEKLEQFVDQMVIFKTDLVCEGKHWGRDDLDEGMGLYGRLGALFRYDIYTVMPYERVYFRQVGVDTTRAVNGGMVV